MGVRKLVILGQSDSAKNEMIRFLLGLPANAAAGFGVDKYTKYVNRNHLKLRFNILNVTGERRFSNLSYNYIVGADLVWLVADANDQSSLSSLFTWSRDAEVFAYGAKVKLLVWQKETRQFAFDRKLMLDQASKMGLQERDCLWVCGVEHVNFANVLAMLHEGPMLSESGKPVPAKTQEKVFPNTHWASFLNQHYRKAILFPIFLLACAAATFFAWPVMLSALGGLMYGFSVVSVSASLLLMSVLVSSAFSFLMSVVTDAGIGCLSNSRRENKNSTLRVFDGLDIQRKTSELGVSDHIESSENEASAEDAPALEVTQQVGSLRL